MNKPKNIFSRDICLTTSPEEDIHQSSIEDEKTERSERQDDFVIFDDMLDYKQEAVDSFFTRGRHREKRVCYLSQLYSHPSKRRLGKNS